MFWLLIEGGPSSIVKEVEDSTVASEFVDLRDLVSYSSVNEGNTGKLLSAFLRCVLSVARCSLCGFVLIVLSCLGADTDGG